MKNLLSLLFLLSFGANAQMVFETGSWSEALNKAKSENKLIFLDAYASWCEPCKVMEAYTFTDLEVGNYYNKNFINVRLDMEEYPGVELAEKYNVSVYPTLLFINGNREIVHRGCGSLDSSEFLTLGEAALDNTANLASFEKRYKEGERSPDFLLDYLDLLDYTCLDAEGFAQSHLAALDLGELKEESGWAVFAAYQWDIYSREFQYLVDNKQSFEDMVGSQPVNAKMYDTFLAQYQEVYESEELHDFGMRALMHALKQVKFSGSDTLTVMMDLHYAEFSEDWETFADNAIEFVGMTEVSDPDQLGELAWKFYLFVESRNKLEIASGWAKQVVDDRPDPSNIDTYASLLYKLGNKKQAVELEKKALEMAKELYEDTAHYEYQLAKFEGR